MGVMREIYTLLCFGLSEKERRREEETSFFGMFERNKESDFFVCARVRGRERGIKIERGFCVWS